MSMLAIDGGRPVRSHPAAPWPSFDQPLIDRVAAVLRSGKVNYWTGDEGHRFEEEYAASVGRKHGIALANGTLALELALRVLGIGPGDDVVVTCRTFVASASCAAMLGARPVFADVDADSQNTTAQTIEAALTPNTKAIIAVHLAGWPCEMDPIMQLAHNRGLKVIEDCAQAHGARYKDKPAGSIGDVGAFSYCQDKIMTTGGEGGLIVLDDPELYESAWSFKDHGKSYDAVHRRQHPPGFRWLHETVGTNWRMTEMQAAIGRVLLGRLPDWVHRRREHAQTLKEHLAAIEGIRLTIPPAHIYHSYYKFYCFVRPERLKQGWDRDRIMNAISAEGVPCYSGGCPEVYREGVFAGAAAPGFCLPTAHELGRTSLMLLVHPTLSAQDIRDTAHAVEKVMQAATA